VAIEGRLRLRSWEDEGGAKRSKLDVVVNQLHLMPRNGKNGSDSGSSVEEVPEEIPF